MKYKPFYLLSNIRHKIHTGKYKHTLEIKDDISESLKHTQEWDCAIATNDVICHTMENKELVEYDLVKVDIWYKIDNIWYDGAICQINGGHDYLVEVTIKALKSGIRAAKVGNTVKNISRNIQAKIQYFNSHPFVNQIKAIDNLCGHGINDKLHANPLIPNVVVDDSDDTPFYYGQRLAIEPLLTYGTGKMKDFKTVDGSLASHFEATIMVGVNKGILLFGDDNLLNEFIA